MFSGHFTNETNQQNTTEQNGPGKQLIYANTEIQSQGFITFPALSLFKCF